MAKSIRDTDKTAWMKLRAQIIERDSGRCQKCGRSNGLEIHHIIPVRHDGTDDPENLCTLCATCHSEWGLFEEGFNVDNIPFAEWLNLPPYVLLLAMYHFAGEKRERSSGELRDEIDKSHTILRKGVRWR